MRRRELLRPRNPIMHPHVRLDPQVVAFHMGRRVGRWAPREVRRTTPDRVVASAPRIATHQTHHAAQTLERWVAAVSIRRSPMHSAEEGVVAPMAAGLEVLRPRGVSPVIPL